jgi:hypothetical protein
VKSEVACAVSFADYDRTHKGRGIHTIASDEDVWDFVPREVSGFRVAINVAGTAIVCCEINLVV